MPPIAGELAQAWVGMRCCLAAVVAVNRGGPCAAGRCCCWPSSMPPSMAPAPAMPSVGRSPRCTIIPTWTLPVQLQAPVSPHPAPPAARTVTCPKEEVMIRQRKCAELVACACCLARRRQDLVIASAFKGDVEGSLLHGTADWQPLIGWGNAGGTLIGWELRNTRTYGPSFLGSLHCNKDKRKSNHVYRAQKSMVKSQPPHHRWARHLRCMQRTRSDYVQRVGKHVRNTERVCVI